MKKNTTSEQFKQFLATFAQLGSMVTAVVVFINLLNGEFDTQYRQTLSALTILVVVILLWVWRWRHITESRRSRNASTASKKDTSLVKSLLGPFMEARGNHYALSLIRRRVEGFLLVLVTVGASIFVGQKINQIGAEISGLQCSYAANRNAPLLVISGFNNLTDQNNAFVNRLYTEMDDRFNEQISVCLSRRVISNSTEAENFGLDLNRRQSATIVVWGDSDDRSYEIHVTPIEWTAFELLIKADAADAVEMDGWARKYLPQIVLGTTQFVEGNNPKAIRTFDTVIKQLEAEPWSGNNQAAFARLYFRLAQLYDNDGQTQASIEAYDQVLNHEPEFHDARLNRGVLYAGIDREKAIEDFSTLINQGAENAVDAYVNRAALQNEWELQKSDYLAAIALKPDAPEYYDYLGIAALYSGEYETAFTVYREAHEFMDTETRMNIIDGLQAMAEEDSSLIEIVGRITTLLNQPAK